VFSLPPLALLITGALTVAACQASRGHVVSPTEVAERDGWKLVEGVPFVEQRGEKDCGAAAVAMVLRYWGVPAGAENAVSTDVASGERGLRASELRELVRARGLDAFLIKGEPADLRTEIEHRRPLIVGLARHSGQAVIGHYEVVVGFHPARRRILTLDPAAGWRESSFQAFAAEWAGAQQLALVVFRRAPPAVPPPRPARPVSH
jgi:ABC-type bacteriocin/lantibiotic exporter with double-glycine peptidase domain